MAWLQIVQVQQLLVLVYYLLYHIIKWPLLINVIKYFLRHGEQWRKTVEWREIIVSVLLVQKTLKECWRWRWRWRWILFHIHILFSMGGCLIGEAHFCFGGMTFAKPILSAPFNSIKWMNLEKSSNSSIVWWNVIISFPEWLSQRKISPYH